MPVSFPGGAYDFLTIHVYALDGRLLSTLRMISNRDQRNTWVHDTIALPSGLGQAVRLRFTVTTDGMKPSEFWLDQITMQ